MENFNKNSALIDIDFSGLIKKYLKNWYLFVISVVVCGAITYLYTKTKKDIFLVKADILISSESGGESMQSAMLKSFSFGNLVGGGGKVDDEINLVSAHSTLRRVAQELSLNKQHIGKHGM